MIGCKTGKVVALAACAKECTKYTIVNKRNLSAQSHTCPVNQTRSSGSIEATVAHDLTTEMCVNSKGNVFVEALVNDYDSTRMLLKHKDNNPKGMLIVKYTNLLSL